MQNNQKNFKTRFKNKSNKIIKFNKIIYYYKMKTMI